MTESIEQFDTVRLPAGIQEGDVPEGALATVLTVYTDPHLAYEIEVADADGQTRYVGVVDPSWVELVAPHGER